MRIKWLGHAAFLIEGEGLRIVTDPYEPNDVNLPAIKEKTDIVIRSSDNDIAHCYVGNIPSSFTVITATEIGNQGVTVKGLKIDAVDSQESILHKDNARANAMYRFTMEGITISHMGTSAIHCRVPNWIFCKIQTFCLH